MVLLFRGNLAGLHLTMMVKMGSAGTARVPLGVHQDGISRKPTARYAILATWIFWSRFGDPTIDLLSSVINPIYDENLSTYLPLLGVSRIHQSKQLWVCQPSKENENSRLQDFISSRSRHVQDTLEKTWRWFRWSIAIPTKTSTLCIALHGHLLFVWLNGCPYW